MFLIDFNQVAISNFMQQVGNHTEVLEEGLLRHMILNSIRHHRSKFIDKYGEPIICSDSKKYWRRDVFPYYKANRKKDRQKSSVDWYSLFNILSKVRDELKDNFPYKVVQLDNVEADDIIAHVINNKKYSGWKKTIISSDKDFFQLCNEEVQIYRPIQKKIVTKEGVLEEFKIHPKNFALARAIAGDKSDNLPGIKGAGLKTIAKRFPWLVREDVYEVGDIVRDCAMQGKKLKIHENIEANEKLLKDNYKIMQLYYPNIRPVNRMMIDKAVSDFEPYFDKIKFTQMLFDDDAGHLNFNDLQQVFRKINN